MTHVRSSSLAIATSLALMFSALGCGGSDTKPPPKTDGGSVSDVAPSDRPTSTGDDAGPTPSTDAPLVGTDAAPADAPAPDAAMDSRLALPMAAVPAPWVGEDIGGPGMPGASGRTGQAAATPARFHVRGSGGDIFGTEDEFHYLHQPVTGDFEIVGRVAAFERTNENSKAGLMVRDSTAPDARNVFMLVHTLATGTGMSKGTRLQFRDKRVDLITGYGDLGSLRPDAPDGPPIWLRLVRKGMLFTGFISADGVSWIKDGEIAIATMPAQVEVGMAVTSHTNDDASIAIFEGVRITALTDPAWSHTEIGTLGGHTSGAPAKFTLQAANRGLQNTRDGLTFVHRNTPFIGDIEVTAHVTALTSAGNETLRAGVLLRNGLEQGDRMAGFVIELGPNGQRYIIQRRGADDGNITTTAPMPPPGPDGGVADGATPDAAGADAAAPDGGVTRPALVPTYVKLVRVGNRFVGFTSTNGTKWDPVVDVTGFVIATNALAGVIVTSGREEAAAQGTLENVQIQTPPVTPLPLLPDAAAPPDVQPDAGADASGG
jgi:hypothetical protein